MSNRLRDAERRGWLTQAEAPKPSTWEIFAGPVANQKKKGDWQSMRPNDRVTFKNEDGDYFEVYLLGDQLIIRVSGSNSYGIAVRPYVANQVALEMVEP